MSKIPQSDHAKDVTSIDRLKQNISILHICKEHGIAVERDGCNGYRGICPFHEGEEATFTVIPTRNLWECRRCDQGGSVIGLVMRLENIGFHEAVDKLLASTSLIQRCSQENNPLI